MVVRYSIEEVSHVATHPSDQMLRLVRDAVANAERAVDEAKERMYDVWNLVTDNAENLSVATAENDWFRGKERDFPDMLKKDLHKLDSIAWAANKWGSELTEMIERLDRKVNAK